MVNKRLNNYGRAFEEIFTRIFYEYGKMVARYPAYFLIGSLIVSGISIIGIPTLKINLDLYKLFVPLDAPVRTEHERFFWIFHWLIVFSNIQQCSGLDH